METEVTSPAGPTSRRCPYTDVAYLFVFPLRAPPSFFEGAARRPYGSGWHSATGLLVTPPHNVAQWQGWPRQGSWWSSVRA
jgi:hypothetical protein